jgi:antitoxin (DNA-binding transcriptional repressor) of toxin-antitoxin stability system
MTSVSKSILKAKMLEYFRMIENNNEEIIVTSNGKPVLKVVPYNPKQSSKIIFSKFHGKIKYYSDLLENTSSEWEEL